MVDLVRYNRRISPELPNISVNRVSSADAENMFGGAAAAVDAFLSAGEQDRIRKNIADAENIARDVQLGTTVIRDANGKEVTKYQTPEMFAGGSRSEQAYNDIVRQRYQNASIEKIRQDVRQMETSNFRDPEGYQAAISAYSDALQLPPTGLLGTELTKAAALSAESIKRRKQEMQFKIDRDQYLADFTAAITSGSEDVNIDGLKQVGAEAFGITEDEYRLRERQVERQQIDENVRMMAVGMNASERLKLISKLENTPDLAEIFMTDSATMKTALAQLRVAYGTERSLETQARLDQLNSFTMAGFEVMRSALETLSKGVDAPGAGQDVQESTRLVDTAIDAINKQFAEGKIDPGNIAAMQRQLRSLTATRKLLRDRGFDIKAEPYLAVMAVLNLSSELASTEGRESLTDLIEISEQATAVLERSRGAGLEREDQRTLINYKDKIDRDLARLRKAAKESNETLALAIYGAEEATNSAKGRRDAQAVFEMFAKTLDLAQNFSLEDSIDITEETRLAIINDQMGALDVTDQERQLVPPELNGEEIYVPRLAAGIIARVKTIPTSINTYMDSKLSNPGEMTAQDAFYIYNLVNAVKAKGGKARDAAQLGFPSSTEDFMDKFSLALRLNEAGPNEAFNAYQAQILAESQQNIEPGARWAEYEKGSKSFDALETNLDGWGSMSANQRKMVRSIAKQRSDFKDVKSAYADAMKIFKAEYAKSEFNFDLGSDQTASKGDTYSLFPIEWVEKGFEEKGIDLERKDYMPEIQAQITAIDPSLKLGENVFLSYEQSSPFDKYTGVYRLVRVTFGDSGDLIPDPQIVRDGQLNASIDVLGPINRAASKAAKIQQQESAESIARMERIYRARNRVQPGVKMMREAKEAAARRAAGEPR
jgi:hypothetical protein